MNIITTAINISVTTAASKTINHVCYTIEPFCQVRTWLSRTVTTHIPENIRYIVHKTWYLFRKQLPYLVLIAAIATAGAFFGLTTSLTIVISPFITMTAYNMIEKRDDYPYNYLEDLTKKAQQGDLPSTDPKQELLERLEAILTAGTGTCSNALIVGPAGCGKTTVIYDLAKLLVDEHRCPRALKGKTLYQLDLKKLHADSRAWGDFETRLLNILAEMYASSGKSILFIDEIHLALLSSAGRISIANFLKGILESGRLQCIGATSDVDFEQIKTDPGFDRRFLTLFSGSASPEKTRCMLHAYKDSIGNRDTPLLLSISDEAIDEAIVQAPQVYPNRALPGSAIKILELTICKSQPSISKQNILQEGKVILGAQDVNNAIQFFFPNRLRQQAEISRQQEGRSDREHILLLRRIDENLTTIANLLPIRNLVNL